MADLPVDDLLMKLTKRMLDLIDRKATDLAPSIMYEPTSLYADQAYLERERLAIFARSPLLLGLTADIPVPGSWHAVEICDTPLLMCRDEDGRARLFLNSCRHRGVKLCEGSGNGRTSFTCPFHAWRYNLCGELTSVPEPEGFEELDRAAHGLVELPIAEKYGLLFGRPTPSDEPLDVDELLCGLGPELADWGIDSFSRFTPHHLHPFRGNWKSAWATFCENYHFAFLHSQTLKNYLVSRRQAIDLYGPHVRMVSALRSIEKMRQQPESEWQPGRHISVQYRFFPTVNFSLYPDKLEAYWIYPGRVPAEGYGVHAVYVREQPATEQARKELEAAVIFGCEDIINAEDFWVTGQTVPGLYAPARPEHLVFGRNEPAVQHFHRQFRETVARLAPTRR